MEKKNKGKFSISISPWGIHVTQIWCCFSSQEAAFSAWFLPPESSVGIAARPQLRQKTWAMLCPSAGRQVSPTAGGMPGKLSFHAIAGEQNFKSITSANFVFWKKNLPRKDAEISDWIWSKNGREREFLRIKRSGFNHL